jgi:hypothetical protein
MAQRTRPVVRKGAAIGKGEAPRTAPPARATPPKPRQHLSKETLELCDWLVDGVTVAANHPDFDGQCRIVGTAKREVAEALRAAGGRTMGDKRTQQTPE